MVFGVMVAVAGCQAKASSSVIPTQASNGWAAGQVLDGKTGQPVLFNSWLEGLARYDVIYLGEEHHNRHHIDAALVVLRSLVDQGYRPG